MPSEKEIRLDDFPSLCEANQRVIISREKRNPSYYHRGLNPGGKYAVRQYRPDGQLVPVGREPRKCDYLVLNDTERRAYFIELKGQPADIAVSQMTEAVRLCGKSLGGYQILYRFVLGAGHGNYPSEYEVWRKKQKSGTVWTKRGVLEEEL